MDKRRVIVDYKSLPESVLEELAKTYPDGYEDGDTIRFKNAKGDMISAIRYESADTIYMVKVSVQLNDMIQDYEVEDEDDDDFDASDIVVPDIEEGEEDEDDDDDED
jgi:DNA-directed RNA polymerase subunit delta